MEHFKSPFAASDLASARAIDNRRFFDATMERAAEHRFFSHPFMSGHVLAAPLPREVAAFVLTSFYKIVSPFTGLLCALGGRSPNLESRFALMDNIYEEMGRGDLREAHPSLYLRMLASIGVSPPAAEATVTLPAIRRINAHLHEVVNERPFAVACAVLASAEATIPPSFPVLAAMARAAFPDIDMTFFDRHGPRDEGHADDASTLFAITAERVDFEAVEAAVARDLDHRAELFDEWMTVIVEGSVRGLAQSQRPPASVRAPGSVRAPQSVRPSADHHSVPPAA